MTQEPTLDALFAALVAHPRTVRFETQSMSVHKDPLWTAEVSIDTHGLRGLGDHMRHMVFKHVSCVSLTDAILGVLGEIDKFLVKHGEE